MIYTVTFFSSYSPFQTETQPSVYKLETLAYIIRYLCPLTAFKEFSPFIATFIVKYMK
jgi:hypothetical protein